MTLRLLLFLITPTSTYHFPSFPSVEIETVSTFNRLFRIRPFFKFFLVIFVQGISISRVKGLFEHNFKFHQGKPSPSSDLHLVVPLLQNIVRKILRSREIRYTWVLTVSVLTLHVKWMK